jgi:large subunit ribosomal protein L18
MDRKSRQTRKLKIRKKIWGSDDKPRITVFRSNKYFYAQAVNDNSSSTLASIRSEANPKSEQVKKLGESFAKQLTKKGIKQALFDRNGYKYHGKVSAFADGMRSANINL